MACYNTIQAYRISGQTKNGKKLIVFKRPDSYIEELEIPCGQCIGCRLRKTSDWALRCTHEMMEHEKNCFITLTFDEEHLPSDYSLDKAHFQKFMKRLRKHVSPEKIRYFMCGEYGGQSWRPHYHAILFNYEPNDMQPAGFRDIHPYFISPTISKLWPYGFHTIAEANYDTAAYVAGYITKKITGDKADDHYKRTIIDWNDVTGEISYYKEDAELLPEYAEMSRRPGIGAKFIEKYGDDCYPSDYMVHEGRKLGVPKYYDKKMEELDEVRIASQRAKRRIKMALTEQESLARISAIEHTKKENGKSFTRSKI